jgi:tetratricopeptide (TPR) repeat protein
VVAWLRETNPDLPVLNINPIGVLNLGFSALNLAVSVSGFRQVNKRLRKIEDELKRIKEQLSKDHQELAKKIDFTFYANFRAALNLAHNAFTMLDIDNRRVSAMQAINRFLEAEEYYLAYADEDLEKRGWTADEYLLTLALAYLSEVRCYLKLEEIPTAYRRIQEAEKLLQNRFQKYVNILLTSNPAAYLHPELKEDIDLTRLTHIFQWLHPEMDENTVYQQQRKNLFKIAYKPDEWKDSLPTAVWKHIHYKGYPGTFLELPKVMKKMEIFVETHQRIKGYRIEIESMMKLGVSFVEWQKLTASEESKLLGDKQEIQPVEESQLIYLLPAN